MLIFFGNASAATVSRFGFKVGYFGMLLKDRVCVDCLTLKNVSYTTVAVDGR